MAFPVSALNFKLGREAARTNAGSHVILTRQRRSLFYGRGKFKVEDEGSDGTRLCPAVVAFPTTL